MSNQTEMDKITDELAEWICDSVCYKPKVIVNQEELDEHCDKCPLADYVCRICNQYNDLNTFEATQSYKLMQKVSELERALDVQKIMGSE